MTAVKRIESYRWWKLALILGIALGAAVVALATSWFEASAHLRQRDLNALRSEVHELQQSLLRCQTGLRGFMIAGDERFLEPYRQCQLAVPDQLKRLAALSAKCGVVPWRDGLAEAVEAVVVDFREIVAAVESGSLNAVASPGAMLASKNLMDGVQASFAVFREQVEADLQRIDEAVHGLHNLTIGVLFVVLSGCVALLWHTIVQTQRLSERLAFERALWESSGDALFLFDLDNGSLMDANPAGERLIGLPKSQIIGRSWQEFVPVDEVSRSSGHIDQLGGDHQPLRHGHLIAGDGRIVPAEATISREIRLNGKRLAVSSFRSLEEREAILNEIALREAIEKSLPSGIACIDEDGVQTYVNEMLCRMVGWPAEELVGQRPPFPYWPPEEQERIQQIFERALSGKIEGGTEVQLMRRSGERFPAEFLVSRIEHATKPGWLANVMDIGERKAQQEELEKARRLEALGRLSRQVAHDFNNLLTVVLMNAALARQSSHAADQQAQIDAIRSAAQRGRDIVASLIAMAREHPLNGQPLELLAIIREAEALYKTVCGPSRTISLVFPPYPVWVIADRGQLDAALLNLIVNARDATASNGTITIRIYTLDLGPDANSRKPGSYIIIEVSDTGHGMSPETRRRAFEPFFSTKGAQGVGLGLATVYGFARQCGGHVELDSAEGVGTTIRITLPLARPADSAMSAPAVGAVVSSSRSLKKRHE